MNKYFLECIILTKLAIDQVLNPGPFPTHHYLQSHQDLAQCLLIDTPYLPPDVSFELIQGSRDWVPVDH